MRGGCLTDKAHASTWGESLGQAVVSIYGASVYLLSVLGGSGCT